MPSALAARIERDASVLPFSEIEDAIEELSVDPELKAALWTLAWNAQSRREQRRTARMHDLADQLVRIAG